MYDLLPGLDGCTMGQLLHGSARTTGVLVERYSLVMVGRRSLIKGLDGKMRDWACGHVFKHETIAPASQQLLPFDISTNSGSWPSASRSSSVSQNDERSSGGNFQPVIRLDLSTHLRNDPSSANVLRVMSAIQIGFVMGCSDLEKDLPVGSHWGSPAIAAERHVTTALRRALSARRER